MVTAPISSSLLRLRVPAKARALHIWLPSFFSSRPIPHASRVSAMTESSTTTPPPHGHSNRLAKEHSPYLLQHAHNPVDWYPWGEEAFEKARARDVPIFLSIGYSTCHWCHVMEVESFENEEVAKLLNDWFISIKVDREERPDVDKVYMTYVQALYNGGGWPLSVFLSPSLKPLMGGTYFPPDDKYGRPGFKTVLRKVKDAWETKRDMLEKGGTLAIEQLSKALSSSASADKLSEGLSQGSLQLCSEQFAKSYDPKFGGFGSTPKFPRPVEVWLMIYQSKKQSENGKKSEANETLKMVCFSLQCMARGGIHDHIGGGFHRYSVDECWHVPHFEKMLYDQGQLANVYLDAFSITKDTFYSTVARDILGYLTREMIGPDGEIYSAEDADSAEYEGASRKKEGAFYIWTSKEVEEVLVDSANLFKNHYYVKASGNCDLSRVSDPHKEFEGKNVLIERKDIPFMARKLHMSVDEYSSVMGMCRQRLFNVRSRRPRPHLDDKVIVSWNGLAISAFARASKILKGEPKETTYNFPVVGCSPRDYLDNAERAASFIANRLYDVHTRRLHHSFRNGPSKAPGFLDDYAFLISGLLDLYEFGGGIKWLSWAIELQATQDELFLDKEGGGYFNTAGEDPSVLLRVKEDHDGAEPSGNSMSALNLIRLSSMFIGEKSDYYRRTAQHLLLSCFVQGMIVLKEVGGKLENSSRVSIKILLEFPDFPLLSKQSSNKSIILSKAVFESRLIDQSVAVPLMCCAADLLSVPSRKQVVLVGDKSSTEFDDMVAAVYTSYDPNRTVIQINPDNREEMEFWEEKNASITQMAKSSPAGNVVVAHVCENFACRAPITDLEALRIML